MHVYIHVHARLLNVLLIHANMLRFEHKPGVDHLFLLAASKNRSPMCVGKYNVQHKELSYPMQPCNFNNLKYLNNGIVESPSLR